MTPRRIFFATIVLAILFTQCEGLHELPDEATKMPSTAFTVTATAAMATLSNKDTKALHSTAKTASAKASTAVSVVADASTQAARAMKAAAETAVVKHYLGIPFAWNFVKHAFSNAGGCLKMYLSPSFHRLVTKRKVMQVLRTGLIKVGKLVQWFGLLQGQDVAKVVDQFSNPEILFGYLLTLSTTLAAVEWGFSMFYVLKKSYDFVVMIISFVWNLPVALYNHVASWVSWGISWYYYVGSWMSWSSWVSWGNSFFTTPRTNNTAREQTQAKKRAEETKGAKGGGATENKPNKDQTKPSSTLGRKNAYDASLEGNAKCAQPVAQCCPTKAEPSSCQTMDKAKTKPKNAKAKEPTPTSESWSSLFWNFLYNVLRFIMMPLVILIGYLYKKGKEGWEVFKAKARTFCEWVRDTARALAWQCMVGTAQAVRCVVFYFITWYRAWKAQRRQAEQEAAARLQAEQEAEKKKARKDWRIVKEKSFWPKKTLKELREVTLTKTNGEMDIVPFISAFNCPEVEGEHYVLFHADQKPKYCENGQKYSADDFSYNEDSFDAEGNYTNLCN